MARSRRKRLGQHFLTDRRVASSVVGLLDDAPPRVLEIGPGRGALTGLLVERFERVLALEMDERLLPVLSERFAAEIRHGDALRADFEPMLANEAPWQVAANLPYSVGTAILRRLLPLHGLVTRLVVMLQREVAERIAARPGAKGHGLLALERAAHAEARVAFAVPPRAFRPRPRVVSAVVVLDLKKPAFEADRLQRGLALAAHALLTPRKMVSNAVRPLADRAALEAAEIPPQVRPGDLPLEAWIRLTDSIAERGEAPSRGDGEPLISGVDV